MIFLTILSLLSVQAHSAPATGEKRDRSGKFMRFGTADDLFSELLDEMHDPLSAADGMEGGLKGSAHQSTPPAYKDVSEQHPTKAEKIAVYNKNTGKFELLTTTSHPSGHFKLPGKQSSENGIIYYGGQQYHYKKSDEPEKGNRIGEIKIFWSSVTDAIENLPFFPVQVNVPDMISAMANFLSTSIPIINRFTNPNHPRLPIAGPANGVQDPHGMYYGSNTVQDNAVEDRELKNGASGKPNKKRKAQRRKNQKRKNNKESTKGFPGGRPFFKRTTEKSTEDKKVWHSLGGADSSGSTLKNMPITRKKFLVRDREVFNFKNSDIRNSPIMILNLPERPMMYHKTDIKQNVNAKDGDHTSVERPLPTISAATTARPKAENRANSKKVTQKSQKRVKEPSERNRRN